MIYVNANGESLELGSRDSHKKKPKPRPEKADFHKGWRVVGHKPGALEEARDFAVGACNAWDNLSAEQRTDKLRNGGEEPEPWDGGAWLRLTKKKPVRSKPYEIPEAADQCAELAKRAGWLSVEVIEIKRGE